MTQTVLGRLTCIHLLQFSVVYVWQKIKNWLTVDVKLLQ